MRAPDRLLNVLCIVNALLLLANEAFLRFVMSYDMNYRVVVWQSLAKALLFFVSWFGALWDASDIPEYLLSNDEDDDSLEEEAHDEEARLHGPQFGKKKEVSFASLSSNSEDGGDDARGSPQDRSREREFLLDYEKAHHGGIKSYQTTSNINFRTS